MRFRISADAVASVSAHPLGSLLAEKGTDREVIVSETTTEVQRRLRAGQPHLSNVAAVRTKSGVAGVELTLVAPVVSACRQGDRLIADVWRKPAATMGVYVRWTCGSCKQRGSSLATIPTNESPGTAALVCRECETATPIDLVQAW